MMVKFNDRLKKLRKERNLSQMALAELVGVSSQSISRWETGNCMPDIFQIVPGSTYNAAHLRCPVCHKKDMCNVAYDE